MSMTNKRSLHDALLQAMPEGAAHDREMCALCSAPSSGKPEGGPVDTFTAEEVQAAIVEATAPLHARLAAMEAAANESELESRVGAIAAAHEAELAEVRSQLDVAVLEAHSARAQLDATIAYLESERAAAEEAVTLEARREERLAKVREVASFPEDYIAAHADRFVAMSDDDFEARIAEWAALSSKIGMPAGAPPKVTALMAARETSTSGRNAMAELRAMRMAGIDPRNI